MYSLFHGDGFVLKYLYEKVSFNVGTQNAIQ